MEECMIPEDLWIVNVLPRLVHCKEELYAMVGPNHCNHRGKWRFKEDRNFNYLWLVQLQRTCKFFHCCLEFKKQRYYYEFADANITIKKSLF